MRKNENPRQCTYFKNLKVQQWYLAEVMLSVYDKETATMKSQKYGCLNKTWTTPDNTC